MTLQLQVRRFADCRFARFAGCRLAAFGLAGGFDQAASRRRTAADLQAAKRPNLQPLRGGEPANLQRSRSAKHELIPVQILETANVPHDSFCGGP